MTVQNSTHHQATGSGGAADPEAYRAARTGAVIFDRSSDPRLRVTGGDRASWLQGLVTNDVAGLAPGSGCYAAYLTPQGRMISDLRVLALEDAFLLDLPAVAVATVAQRFDLFIITEDVAVEDVTASVGRLAIHGPGAAATLAAALAGPDPRAATGDAGRTTASPQPVLAQLREHHWLALTVDDPGTATGAATDLLIAGARQLGVAGFDVYLSRARAPWLCDRLVAAGARVGSDAIWHVLRVEAGTPVFGEDMDETTIPLEAGIEDRAISFTKGCYVGQEVIIRVMHRGQGRVARKLVALVEDAAGRAGPAPVAGGVLLSGEGSRDIGRLTSVAHSPALHRWIALGYLHRDFLSPGTIVGTHADGGTTTMVVTVPPLV